MSQLRTLGRHSAVLLISVLSYAVVPACTPGAGSDAGTSDDGGSGGDGDGDLKTCSSLDDCPNTVDYDCLGVCLFVCGSNDDKCAADEYCDPRGYCAEGCRDSAVCLEGEVCFQGSCVPANNADSCGTKCDCDPGQVCTDGICGEPPETCATSSDCPAGPDADTCEAIICNGFTSACAWPDPPPCEEDADCAIRPECASEEGCSCDVDTGACVLLTPCTVDDEDAVCGGDSYCDAEAVCQPLPACSADAECDPLGTPEAPMVCAELIGRCERYTPCEDATDCAYPTAFCDTGLGECVVPDCLNGGAPCLPNTETCEADGSCEPIAVGGGCMGHADCNNTAPWPASEYCNTTPGQTEGECASGCANSSVCPSGQTCNAQRQCTGGPQPNGWGESCTDSSECQVGLICGLLSGSCAESCDNTIADCGADPNCCSISNATSCNTFGFCSNSPF